MSDYPGIDQWHAIQIILSDSHKPSAANLALSGSEPDMDRFLYLYNRRPVVAFATSTVSGVGTIVGPGGQTNVWQNFDTTGGLDPSISITGCKIGDILVCQASGAFIRTNGSYAHVRLNAVQDALGTPLEAEVPGAIARVDVASADAFSKPLPTTLVGRIILTKAGVCQVRLQGRNQGGSGYAVGFVADPTGYPFTLVVERFRA